MIKALVYWVGVIGKLLNHTQAHYKQQYTPTNKYYSAVVHFEDSVKK